MCQDENAYFYMCSVSPLPQYCLKQTETVEPYFPLKQTEDLLICDGICDENNRNKQEFSGFQQFFPLCFLH
jgi:hypothetical protein